MRPGGSGGCREACPGTESNSCKLTRFPRHFNATDAAQRQTRIVQFRLSLDDFVPWFDPQVLRLPYLCTRCESLWRWASSGCGIAPVSAAANDKRTYWLNGDARSFHGWAELEPGVPPDIGRPFVAGVQVRLVVCRRSLSLGGRPGLNFFDVFFERREADGGPAFRKLLRIFDLARREAPVGVPVELGAVALRAPLEESDPVLEHGCVSSIRLPFPCRRREERQCPTEEVGLRDRVLQYQPGRLRPVRTDKVRSRPSDRPDDSPKAPGVASVHPSHPWFIAGVEEPAGGCEFVPHSAILPGHVQEVAPEELGLVA